MPTISLCMIVYNEEENIRRCLESVRRFADEIIIVDTGSTDLTKSICREFGARVFDREWKRDFSEARNYSISKASCDWILLLDADEELEIHNPSALKAYLDNTQSDLVTVYMTHYYGEQPADENRAHFSSSQRLIRNDGAMKFSGRIHEKLDTNGKNIDLTGETRKFIKISHYGYMKSAEERKKDRNITLLLEEKQAHPKDPWLSYYIASEYYRSGKIEDAFWEVNNSIALFLAKQIKPPALAYKLKYDMLVASGYHELAYSGIDKAISLYPDYVDLYFYRGILQYCRGEYAKARNTFIYCLILGETNVDYLIQSGCGSFLALYYIGLCYEKQGEHELAAESLRQAEMLCPDLRTAEIYFRDLPQTV